MDTLFHAHNTAALRSSGLFGQPSDIRAMSWHMHELDYRIFIPTVILDFHNVWVWV